MKTFALVFVFLILAAVCTVRGGYSTSSTCRQCIKVLQPREAKVNNMKTFALVFVFLILAAVCTDANPIIKESVAKQLFRSQRQQRPAKAGHPDEPMREGAGLRSWEAQPQPT